MWAEKTMGQGNEKIVEFEIGYYKSSLVRFAEYGIGKQLTLPRFLASCDIDRV